ncbi:hypothetical protein CMI46_02195 [Candidatus Pacearchaeota archaeon]|nr:hypothetical protein [Candidatus Pacearchaeota archaeon]|tara:strand:+ start:3200 stop:3382 length:183 start_codon:yes stop_codon:yes gene_type:complete
MTIDLSKYRTCHREEPVIKRNYSCDGKVVDEVEEYCRARTRKHRRNLREILSGGKRGFRV